MPTDTPSKATVLVVGKQNPEDRVIAERIRAHVRERMTRLDLGPTAAGELLHCHQGTVSNILQGKRGPGLGFAARVADGLNIDLVKLFKVDPDREFFRAYVPNASTKRARKPKK